MIFESVPGVRVYVDNVLIWGTDKTQHDQRLRAMLERAEKAELKLYPEKCVFGMTEMTFPGGVINKGGVRPSLELIQGVRAMPAPEEKKCREKNDRCR